jgi:hypothetical protein
MSNANNSSEQTASSAPAPVEFVQQPKFQPSQSDARQTSAVPSELAARPSHYASRDAVSVINRRTIMNMMFGAAIAGAAFSSNPTTASAVAIDSDLRALEAYASWLHMERRLLCLELYPHMGKHAEKFVFAMAFTRGGLA